MKIALILIAMASLVLTGCAPARTIEVSNASFSQESMSQTTASLFQTALTLSGNTVGGYLAVIVGAAFMLAMIVLEVSNALARRIGRMVRWFDRSVARLLGPSKKSRIKLH